MTAPDTGLHSRDRAIEGQDGHRCTQLPRLSLRVQIQTHNSFAAEGPELARTSMPNCHPASPAQQVNKHKLSKNLGSGEVITVRADKITNGLPRVGGRRRNRVKLAKSLCDWRRAEVPGKSAGSA